VPTPKSTPQGALEQTIGLKWAGWIGAVVLVFGAALGVKFVYDQHWFAAVPPAVWLSMIFLAGLALIGAGEFVYRRVHSVPAASLFGAGIATLFLASFVGHKYYELYPPTTAFWLMAATAVVGSAVAVRGNLVSIAVLAQLGANVAPMLLGNRGAPLSSFLLYLTSLEVVALGLALWGQSPKWWILRGLSLASMCLWMVPILGRDNHGGTTALAFMLIWAALYHAEVILSAFIADRSRESRARIVAPHGGAVFLTVVTAALVAGMLWAMVDSSRMMRTSWVLGIAAFAGILGAILRRSGGAVVRALVAAYVIQFLALVILAVPIALTGTRIEIAWALLAIVLAVVSRTIRAPAAAWGSLATWTLAVLHLANSWVLLANGGNPVIWLHVSGHDITSQAIIAWGLSLSGLAIATILTREDDAALDEALPILRFASSAIWLIASIIALPALGATFWIVIYAWLLLALSIVASKAKLDYQAAAILQIATIKWIAIDTLLARINGGSTTTQYLVAINAQAGVGLMLATSIAAAGAWRRSKSLSGSEALFMIALFVIAWAGSFEIDRAIQSLPPASLHFPMWQSELLIWTIWWTAGVVGAFLVARWLTRDAQVQPDWLRIFPVLMMLIAAKFLIVDALAWRILEGAAPAPVGANLLAAAGAVVIGGLVTLAVKHPDEPRSTSIRRVLVLMSALVLLWICSLEIDRAFELMIASGSRAFADPGRARQVALSIFWSMFAVGAVAGGFKARFASLRYFGLGLLAVALLKVVIVDLRQVSTGYRILSFMGVGLLMLGTSVLYGKLSPRLLGKNSAGLRQEVLER